VLVGFAIIGLVIAAGYVADRFGTAPPGSQYALNRIAFFIASPALLFTVLAKADLAVVLSAHVAVAGLSAVLAAALYVLTSRLAFRRSLGETTIGALGAGYINANNIGLPVAVYVLGNASYVAPALLVQLIVFAPAALTVLDVASRGGASARDIMLQPVRNPIILASIAGIVVDVLGWRLPDVIVQPLTILGGAAVPMVLLAFGMSLRGTPPLKAGEHRGEVIVASAIKGVVMPAIAFLLGRFVFGLAGQELFAVVAIAALPSAQNVFNYAARYRVGETIARDTVLLTTLLAVPVLLATAALFAPA
jgi:predicted permease